MMRNHLVIQVHSLKYDQSLAFKHRSISNVECHGDFAFRVSGTESLFCRDIAASCVQCRFAGSFIHQDTAYHVGKPSLESAVGDRINDLRSAVGVEFLLAVFIRRKGSDSGNPHTLIFIFQLFVFRDHTIFIGCAFIRDNSGILQKRGVKGEVDSDRTTGVFGRVFHRRGDCVPGGIVDSISSFLVDQCACKGVFLTDNQVFIRYIVCEHKLIICEGNMGVVLSQQYCTDLRDCDCLILILDIFVGCYGVEPVGERFKGNQALPCHLGNIECKENLCAAIRLCRRKARAGNNCVAIRVSRCSAGGFIHQCAIQSVGLSRHQIDIIYCINNSYSTFCQ